MGKYLTHHRAPLQIPNDIEMAVQAHWEDSDPAIGPLYQPKPCHCEWLDSRLSATAHAQSLTTYRLRLTSSTTILSRPMLATPEEVPESHEAMCLVLFENMRCVTM